MITKKSKHFIVDMENQIYIPIRSFFQILIKKLGRTERRVELKLICLSIAGMSQKRENCGWGCSCHFQFSKMQTDVSDCFLSLQYESPRRFIFKPVITVN